MKINHKETRSIVALVICWRIAKKEAVLVSVPSSSLPMDTPAGSVDDALSGV
jgi:hypothetical protein